MIARKRITIAALAAAAGLMVTPTAGADAHVLDFETYTPGSIHGQDGWSSSGSAGLGCAAYDHAVVDNVSTTYGYASFGDRSLRMSNAVTSGCFGDHTFSKSLGDETGETDATNDGMSGGTRQRTFVARWDFASTSPGGEQVGLAVVASPDRGDGARMSWIQMKDTPGGLEVNFFDYKTGLGVPCTTLDNFRLSTVATGLDRTTPHTITVAMVALEGVDNDIVIVNVDGIHTHIGNSWEDFFRDCQPPGSRTVDSILFRTGGDAAPATAGKGFLIDNLTLLSGVPGLPV